MLIEADDTILEYFKNKSSLGELNAVVIAMNGILRSVLLRHHIFFASLELFQVLLECEYIDLTNKAVVQFMLDRYATIGAFIEGITTKIVVTEKENRFEEQGTAYYVDIRKLMGIEGARLIAEHGTDADAYIDIGYKIIEWDGHREIDIDFEKKSCYGSNVRDAIQSCLGRTPIMLCIIDSDKKYMTDNFGTTFTAAYSEVAQLKGKEIIELYSMGVKEKENMYPYQWYKYADKNTRFVIDTLDEYEPTEEFLRFYDIKEGIKVKDYKGADKNWRALYNPWVELCDEKNILIHSLKEVDKLLENDSLVQGVGSDLADKVNMLMVKGKIKDYYETKRVLKEKGFPIPESLITELNLATEISQNIKESLPEWLYEEWRKLGEKIIMWGLCFSEEFVPRCY